MTIDVEATCREASMFMWKDSYVHHLDKFQGLHSFRDASATILLRDLEEEVTEFVPKNTRYLNTKTEMLFSHLHGLEEHLRA